MSASDVLVTGAGGFIGGHLVAALRQSGCRVRAVDIKPLAEWHQRFDDVDNRRLDLRQSEACVEAASGMDHVYQLAADMGGMGFIETHKAQCMLNVLINTHMLLACRDAGVARYLFASSACVYNRDRQLAGDARPLRESDAYPAMPEDGYGWEKLFSERMCRHFSEDFGLTTRVVRLHNVYGPWGTWEGGREKAPAAICRKVIEARDSKHLEIEIWGDGTQQRSFMYVDDCIEGMQRIMASDVAEPINLGSSETVTIHQLVDIAESLAGVRLTRTHRLDAPQGVESRSSDNTLILDRLGWQPSTSLRDGLARTFAWIEAQIRARGSGAF